MPRKQRRFSTFSLSFLDIMSCGLGAVALIFLIIKHEIDTKAPVENQNMLAEVNLLEEDIRVGKAGLTRLKNTLSDLDQELADADGLARRINDDITAVEQKIAELDEQDTDQQIKSLQAQLKNLEEQKKKLASELENRGNDVRKFIGQGDRQYLTGLKLGGKRVLVLLDASGSMLDESLVNIIRRRNMSADVQRASAKWRRAQATVSWLTSQLPPSSHYQIYTFNTAAKPALAATQGQWLPVDDTATLDKAVLELQKIVPAGGTSLINAFVAMSRLDPLPDNIFLITDGLPTQGGSLTKNGTINGVKRLKLFNEAVSALPKGIPVNIILAPMEGDPMAAAAYWRLAQNTRGSFLSPSKDWP